MKKSYLSKRNLTWMIRKGLNRHKTARALGFVLFILLTVQFSMAQTAINWTGLIDSDASKSVNWDPQLTPPGNILNIDSAYKFTNLPVYNVASSITLYQISPAFTSQFEINVAKDSVVDVNGSSSAHLYGHGRFTKGGEGLLTFRANIYLESIEDTVNVNNGTLEIRSSLLMGTKTGSSGGYLNISGNGVVYSKGTWAPGRFATDTLQSVITITDNGRLEVSSTYPTDWSNDAKTYVAKNQIKSTPDREIIVEFDNEINRTIVYSRDKMAFLVEPAETQNIEAKTDGEILRILKTDGLASMNSLTWKYSTTSGSGYVSFPTAQTGDTLVPNFNDPGTFFVVCIGDNGTTTDTTSEIKFIVSSDKVHVTPDGPQKIKLGQEPYMLTVTEDEKATSRQWVYSTTLDGTFEAFVPDMTDSVITPVFDEVGTYYVMCRSVISGTSYETKQVEITVTPESEWSDIRWLGTYSNEAGDVRNWYPHAPLYKNTLTIDPNDYVNEPILTTSGNDTIGNLGIQPGASFTLNKPEGDVLYRGSDHYLTGHLLVKSGSYVLSGRIRADNNDGIIDISGGSIEMKTDFIVGQNNGPAGGLINIFGNGIIDAGGQIWRFATDTTRSVITIWDNGKLIIHNSDTSSVKTWISKNQLKTLEDWELVVNYNPGDTTIIITAFDPNAISVSPTAKQTLAIDEPASELAASNTAIYDSLIWKYSTSVGGDLTAFEPAIHDTFAAPSFSEAGTYYVVCVGMNDTLTKVSNAIQILVPGVTVSPADKQVSMVKISSVDLEVSELPEADSRKWKYATTPGGPYAQDVPPSGFSGKIYAVTFNTTGTNYIVCESTYGTKVIQSNEVEVEVIDIQVAPSVKQTISKNTDGKTIAVTETGSVDSREWMYSTTPGEGYVSFDPAQTSTDYTPNFPQPGTYYVACATVFSGVTMYSKDVTILVTGDIGVNNTDINNLAVYPNPTTGKFVINEETTGNYRIDVYNSQGKIILSDVFNGNEGPQEFMLDKKGIYVVNLVAQDYIKTTKLIVE
jgi:hypothetical protein